MFSRASRPPSPPCSATIALLLVGLDATLSPFFSSSLLPVPAQDRHAGGLPEGHGQGEGRRKGGREGGREEIHGSNEPPTQSTVYRA